MSSRNVLDKLGRRQEAPILEKALTIL